MKRLFAILLLFFPPFTCAQSPPASAVLASVDKKSCSISGTVVRQDNGEPLSKAKVMVISREKWEESTFDLTDAQGHFLLEDLGCLPLTLNASHPGFVEASYGQRKPSDPGAVLTLAPGQKVTGLVFKLPRAAIITGRVFDENGALVQGALVHTMRATRRAGRREFEEAGKDATNDLGEFRIFDLQPGRYYVGVTYNPWFSREGFDPKPRRHAPKRGYPVLYYPGTTDPAKAAELTLGPGDEISAIDLRLLLTSMNTVSGKILNLPKNTAWGTASVFLDPRGSAISNAGWNYLEASVEGSNFVIDRVPPGSYELHAAYLDRETKSRSWSNRLLDVTDADIENITISLLPSFTVPGHVTWESNKAADASSLMALLISTDENTLNPQPEGIQPDGSFSLRSAVEGEYRPRILDPSKNCYLKSARVGTTPMAEGKLTIHFGGDNSLEYLVSCRAAQLTGQVLTADSLPAEGVFVVLVPETRFRDDSEKFYDGKTDQYGHFLLKGITTGDYKLFSWSSVEHGDWQDTDFLKPYEDKGVSVHLEEGDRKSVDLTLIEPPRGAPPANE